MWYPRHKLQFRIGLLWAGAAIAGAFSGLLAYGISFMSGIGGKLGWSWIFVSYFLYHLCPLFLSRTKILEGLLTIIVGIVAYFGNVPRNLPVSVYRVFL